MNYRHIYHAGNICDVVKHAVLALVIDRLKAKDTPFAVIDTHAGIGLYDLQDERAGKTSEAHDGILKLLDAPRIAGLESYYGSLQQLNPEWNGVSSDGCRYYPGSPVLTMLNLRATDRLVACELHPEDADQLKRQLFRFKRAQTHHRDGYQALGALLPPPEKRGLVLIDPPFEQTDEFARLAETVIAAQARWPTGIYMLWYPIKERPAIWRFHEQLIAAGIPKILAAEFIYRDESDAARLNGSGLILINPPWQLDAALKQLFCQLHQALQTPAQGVSVEWLTAA